MDVKELEKRFALFEAPEVEIGGEKVTLYDADTSYKLDPEAEPYSLEEYSEGKRFYGLDAPEAPGLNRLESGAPDMSQGFVQVTDYNPFERNYVQAVKEKIDEGYNTPIFMGKDRHDRDLTVLQNPYGDEMHLALTREGTFDPSRYNFNDANIQASYDAGNHFRTVNNLNNADPWKKTETAFKMLMSPIVEGEEIQLGDSQYDAYKTLGIKREDPNSVEAAMNYYWNQAKVNSASFAVSLGMDTLDDVKAYQEEIQRETPQGFIIGLEDVEDISDLTDFALNNIMIQGPDYAIVASGTTIGASIGTMINPGVGTAIGGGIGFLISKGWSFLQSVGSVQGEIIETTGKPDIALAWSLGVPIALLDIFGATKLFDPREMLNKDGRKKLIEHVANRDNISEEAAKELVEGMTKKIIASSLKESALGVSAMISKKKAVGAALNKALKQGGKEVATEMTQESIQYFGIHGIPQSAEEWEKYGWRLANAGAAGGIVGTAYSMPNSVGDYLKYQGMRNDTIYDINVAKDSAATAFQTKEATANKSVRDSVEDYDVPVTGKSIFEWAEKAQGRMGRRVSKITRGQYNPFSNFRKRSLLPLLRDTTGKIVKGVAILGNVEGALQNMKGNTYHKAKASLLGTIPDFFTWLDDKGKSLATPSAAKVDLDSLIDRMSSATFDLKELNTDEFNVANEIVSRVNEFILKQLIPNASKKDKERLAKKVDGKYVVRPDAWKDFFKSNFPDMLRVRENAPEFIGRLAEIEAPVTTWRLMKGEKVGEANARELYNLLMQGRELGTVIPTFRDLNVYGAMPDFYTDSTTDRLANNVVQQSLRTIQNAYRGSDNLNVYSNIINELYTSGVIDEARASELAQDLLDLVDMDSGSYGRIQSGKEGIVTQAEKYVRSVSIVQMLDEAAFAQGAEAVFAFLGTKAKDPRTGEPAKFQTPQVIHNFVKGFVRNVAEDFKLVKEGDAKRDYLSKGYDENEIARQQGADMENSFLERGMRLFFKLNLLKPLTDTIRMQRMNLGLYTLEQLALDLVDLNGDYSNMTQYQAHAYERLSYYGADFDNIHEFVIIMKMLQEAEAQGKDYNQLSPELRQAWDKWATTMAPKFTDELTVRIEPGSRWAIMEEKRFGVPFFTMFMSFTSHWTSNILPRVWQQYIKEATAPIAFNTFKVVAGALMMAYLSQYLKDLIRYGRISPYLHEYGDIQRAVDYSGIFGTGMEVYNRIVSDSYGNGGTIEDMLAIPALSNFSGIKDKLIEGEYAKAAEKGLPFGGLVKSAYNAVASEEKNGSTIEDILGSR